MTADAIRVRRARVAVYGPAATGLIGAALLVSGTIGLAVHEFGGSTAAQTQAPAVVQPATPAAPAPAITPDSPALPVHGQLELVGADARLYPVGDLAQPLIGIPPRTLGRERIVGAARAATGGAWLATADGHVYSAGAHPFGGATLAKTAARIVGIATAADGRGYRLVSADGHVYSFGVPGRGEHVVGKGAAPAIGIGSAAGDGYWVAYADGTVAAFNAPSLGNAKLARTAARVVAITGSLDGRGYWLATSDGRVHTFGVPYRGDLVSTHVPPASSALRRG